MKEMKDVYKNYSPEEFVNFILSYFNLTKVDFIGEIRGRKIYKLYCELGSSTQRLPFAQVFVSYKLSKFPLPFYHEHPVIVRNIIIGIFD